MLDKAGSDPRGFRWVGKAVGSCGSFEVLEARRSFFFKAPGMIRNWEESRTAWMKASAMRIYISVQHHELLDQLDGRAEVVMLLYVSINTTQSHLQYNICEVV